MSDQEPAVLVTGFEAFGDHSLNPSASILGECPEQYGGYGLSTALLPVSYRRAPEQLATHLAQHPWRAVLLLGLAETAPGWRIETLAYNHNGTTPDNDGLSLAGQAVLADEPRSLAGSLPADAMYQSLKLRGLPVSLSEYAGDYLCNYMFFWLMAWRRQWAPDLVGGFVHVPPISADATAPTAWPGHQRAFDGLLGALVTHLRA